MRFDLITIFPNMLESVTGESILKRAQESGKIKVHVHNLRDYTLDKHKKVDDKPFGGGPGMLMSAQPIIDAVKTIKGRRKAKVILTCPTGKRFDQRLAKTFAKEKNLIIISGHYEGVDERVRQTVVDESVSIGDYILTGGELPALVMVDCIARLVPGVLGKNESLHCESFEDGLLEYPQYTRPADFRGLKVPEVLLSGNHADIEKWRKQQAVKVTKERRSDLL